MTDRIIAIGDIHGCSTALKTLLTAIDLRGTDTLVTLGDYIDRGPDSSGVVETLCNLLGSCNFVPLLGNHELIMKDALQDSGKFNYWMNCGNKVGLYSFVWNT